MATRESAPRKWPRGSPCEWPSPTIKSDVSVVGVTTDEALASTEHKLEGRMNGDFSGTAGRARSIDPCWLPERSACGRSWRTTPSKVPMIDGSPEASIAALREAGLFKVMLPRRYGGYEAGTRTSLDVMTAIAHGDGATAWVASLANHSAWDIGLCSTRVQDEVFGANPDTLVCGSLPPTGTAVAVDGGVRLSGRWGYVSGSLHAQWAVLGFNVVDETGAVVEAAIAPVPATTTRSRHVVHRRDEGLGKQHAHRGGRVRAEPSRGAAGTPDAGDYPTEHEDEVTYRSAWYATHTLGLVGPLLGLGLRCARPRAGCRRHEADRRHRVRPAG